MTLTDLAIPRPSADVDVFDLCQQIEAHAEQVTDIPELQNAKAKLSAIDAYLERTSVEGRARLAATMRRLEVRIGELLGPAERTGRPASGEVSPASETSLTPNERRDFRDMAEHADEVEAAIAESTDEKPASRRGVLTRIRKTPEQIAVDEEEGQVRRMAVRLQEFINGVHEFERLPDNPRRDRVLAYLNDADRAVIDEYEGKWLA